MSRVILIDPVTGCVEGVAKTKGNDLDSARRKAGALMKRKGLTVSKIKSGNNYAG